MVLLAAFLCAALTHEAADHDWAVRSTEELRSAGLMEDYPYELMQCRRESTFPTRYELAAQTWIASVALQKLQTSFADSPPSGLAPKPTPLSRHFDTTLRLMWMYKVELAALGLTEAQLEKTLAALEAGRKSAQSVSERNLPFTDVPSDHWAAKAVQTLKSEGLLKGYPNGSFQGGK